MPAAPFEPPPQYFHELIGALSEFLSVTGPKAPPGFDAGRLCGDAGRMHQTTIILKAIDLAFATYPSGYPPAPSRELVFQVKGWPYDIPSALGIFHQTFIGILKRWGIEPE